MTRPALCVPYIHTYIRAREDSISYDNFGFERELERADVRRNKKRGRGSFRVFSDLSVTTTDDRTAGLYTNSCFFFCESNPRVKV